VATRTRKRKMKMRKMKMRGSREAMRQPLRLRHAMEANRRVEERHDRSEEDGHPFVLEKCFSNVPVLV
jgi:hypothetical protein